MYRNPTHRNGSETKRESKVDMAFRVKDAVRHPGASEGRRVICRTDAQ